MVLHMAYESIAYFLKQTFENPYYVYMSSIQIRIQKERRHYYYYNMDNGKLDKTNVPFVDMIKNLHNWHKIRRIISLGFCTSQLFSLMTFVSWMLAHIVKEEKSYYYHHVCMLVLQWSLHCQTIAITVRIFLYYESRIMNIW